ncbi:MAG: hypothetical protein A4E73_00780 [Syntrophaceae bacterium PtaU1.Bin231]|nr:MAG: hypothetical protein A4E73_00780 [Syntrophaceae bacterium PtaU1.Bin231]
MKRFPGSTSSTSWVCIDNQTLRRRGAGTARPCPLTPGNEQRRAKKSRLTLAMLPNRSLGCRPACPVRSGGNLFFVRAGVSMVSNHSSAPWEAAIVLFSDFGPYGGLDDESLRRLNFVLDLHRSGHAPVIICSGGTRPSRNLHGSAFMKRYLVGHGIEESRVIEENHSNHTLRNLSEARDILKKCVWNGLLLSVPRFTCPD